MIKHGIQLSNVRPLDVEVLESKVFVASKIEQVTIQHENMPVMHFQFDLVEYSKDEYIKLISERNKALEAEMTSAQLALCEIYEALV